jgi:hypothetical protein
MTLPADGYLLLVYACVLGIVLCALACGMADCLDWLRRRG